MLRCQVYFFSPRPWLGERIAIGAILHLPSERRFFLAPNLPTEPFLTQATVALLRLGLRQIERTSDERELSNALGPHWHTTEQIVPVGCDADAWVQRLFDE